MFKSLAKIGSVLRVLVVLFCFRLLLKWIPKAVPRSTKMRLDLRWETSLHILAFSMASNSCKLATTYLLLPQMRTSQTSFIHQLTLLMSSKLRDLLIF